MNPSQRNELRWLVTQPVRESAGVIRARARSEQDVKGYLRTGLAMEQHWVGQLLELHQQHIKLDELDEEFWDSFNTLDRQASRYRRHSANGWPSPE